MPGPFEALERKLAGVRPGAATAAAGVAGGLAAGPAGIIPSLIATDAGKRARGEPGMVDALRAKLAAITPNQTRAIGAAGQVAAGPVPTYPIYEQVARKREGKPSWFDFLNERAQTAPVPAQPTVEQQYGAKPVDRQFSNEASALDAETEWMAQNRQAQEQDASAEQSSQMDEAIARKKNEDEKRASAVSKGTADQLQRNKK
jgi:hypothetical protein